MGRPGPPSYSAIYNGGSKRPTYGLFFAPFLWRSRSLLALARGGRAQTVAAEGVSSGKPVATEPFLPARFYLKEFIPKNLWDYISYSELLRADRAARSGKWSGVETLYSADDEFCRIVLDALQEDYSRLAVAMRKPGMVGGLNAGEWNPSCEQRRLDASLGYAGSSQHPGQCGTKFEPPPESVKWRWVGWERELPLPVEGGSVFAVSRNGLLHDIPVQSGIVCDSRVPKRTEEPGNWHFRCTWLGPGEALSRVNRSDNSSVYFQFLNVLRNKNGEYFPVYYRPITVGKYGNFGFEYLKFYATRADIKRIPGSRPEVTETLMCEFAEAWVE